MEQCWFPKQTTQREESRTYNNVMAVNGGYNICTENNTCID